MAKVTTQFDVDLAQWQAKIAQIKADQRAIDQQARNSAKTGSSLATGLQSAAGALGITVGVGAAVLAVKGLNDDLVRTANLAAKLDVTAESIQRIGLMAARGGVDVETVTSDLIKLERSLYGSAKDPEIAKAFESLGINARQFITLSPEEKLIQLAAALQKADREGRGATEMFGILSKKAESLLPVLRQNTSELENLSRKHVISPQQIEDVKRMNDDWNENLKIVQVIGVETFNTFRLVGDALVHGKNVGDAIEAQKQKTAQLVRSRDDLAKKTAEAKQAAFDHDAALAAETARIKAENAEVDKTISLRRELQQTQFEIGFKNLPPVGQLIAITRQMKEISDIAHAEGPIQESEELRLKITLDKLRERGEVIRKEIEDQKRKQDFAGEEFQIQLQIDAAKVASGGEETAEIHRMQDKLAAKRIQLQLEQEYKFTAAAALAIANQQVSAARLAANISQIKQRSTDARDLKGELEILGLRSRHLDQEADKKQKQLDIDKQARELHDRLGLDPAAARAIAERKSDLEDRANGKYTIGPSRNPASLLHQQNAQNAQQQQKGPVQVESFKDALEALTKIATSLDQLNSGD